jgi:stalled ribosome rescue protein Dom34
MANVVVWIDSTHAKLFELHGETTTEVKLKKHEVRHHNGTEKEQNNHKNSEKFFHDVALHLSQAHEVLLIGPGEGKSHFKSHLEKHHHKQVALKIVGVETVDHPTDGQIVALAKKFFKAHLAFE